MLNRRFIASGHRAEMPLVLRMVLAGLLVLIATSGCRSAWRTSSKEPSFDRLIEIEQRSSQNGAAPGAQASRTRPSPPKYPIVADESGVVLPAAAASVQSLSDQKSSAGSNDDDMEEMLVDVPPSQRELLRREMVAMHARNRNADAPPAHSNAKPASTSTARTIGPAAQGRKANGRLSDQDESRSEQYAANYPEDEAALNEDMSETELNDEPGQGEEMRPLPAKYQLVRGADRPSKVDSGDAQSENEPYVRRFSDRQEETTPDREAESQVAQGRRSNRQQAGKRDGEVSPVVPASYSQPTSAASHSKSGETSLPSQSAELDWRGHLNAALEQLSQPSSTSNPEEQIHQQMVDRLLHLSLGDIEAASAPIEGLQAGGQDFVRHSLKSLYDVTNPNGNPVEIKRYTLAMLSQRQAMHHLASVSNLEVNNATFCSEVDGFGVVTKFPQNAFKADQELLLYCELDSFVSTQVEGKGYETQLQGSYEIVDANGRRVADQLLPLDSHLCRNQRRDYFIAYRIYMPPKIDAGKYQLKLTIEDLKGRKFGQSNLDFQIQ
jgi:hypothetical protein